MRLWKGLLGAFSLLALVTAGCDCTAGVCDCTTFPHGYGVYCPHLLSGGPPGADCHVDAGGPGPVSYPTSAPAPGPAMSRAAE